MKKLKSFTLVEIIVTLVIGVLVILLAGSLYTSIQKIYTNTLTQYEENRELLTLYFILKQEFNHSDLIYKQYNSYTFRHADMSRNTVEFNDDMVLYVRGGLRDTIKIACRNFELNSLLRDDTYITYLKFDAMAQKKLLPMSFYKEYTAGDYINQNIRLNGN